MHIRPATERDQDALWDMLRPVIRAGETYALDRDMPEDQAVGYWTAADKETFVAVERGEIVGTYYLRSNQAGGGRHVCNCGYVTRSSATGRGIASAMAVHSLAQAAARGYRAMQFNCVVSTNERAVQLWTRLGFDIVGRLPGAFHHPLHNYVDALVMFRPLSAGEEAR